MKIALLLGVSQYANPQNNLPSCDNDLSIMEQLLNLTEEYSEIKVINGSNLSAIEVKQSLANWFEEKQNQKNELDEIFVYYTGHGMFHDEEFYFQLFDFESTKRQQTSLKNTELDNWLRNLSAELTVKVIDACHSGVSYIKDGNNFAKSYFQDAKNGFKKCIFMFSSTTQQSSWQDNQLSHFTRSFVRAVQSHPSEIVRYRNIADYISDEFESNTSIRAQTPTFVGQNNNNEVFCRVNDKIRHVNYPSSVKFLEDELGKNQVNTLKNLVEIDAKHYLTKEKGLELLSLIKTRLLEYKFSDELNDLYRLDCEILESTDKVLLSKKIGQWFSEHNHSFFAEEIFHMDYDYGDDSSEMLRLSILALQKRTKKIVDGFKFTVDVPFQAIRIVATTNYPNIPRYYGYITYAISSLDIKIFYLFTNVVQKNWDKYIINTEVDWSSIDFTFADHNKVIDGFINCLSEFEAHILKQLKSRFGIE